MDYPFSRFSAPWQRLLILTLLTLAVALPGIANLQVIDRDEARYVQASIQMAESGDYVNIRFQDQARNKKPAGIYWMQTAMIKAFTKEGERKIWAQRLPSVLGALLAVLATYWGGARLIGRDGAFIAAMLLAVSSLFVFEAHIAKTDAMLCGLSALTLGCLAHIRNGGGRKSGVLFWLALGLAVMIKGPILPGIVALTVLTLIIWERRAGWLKSILFWPGPILFLLIILPWSILIWQATDGQFFIDALGKDFGGKIVGVQEKHPGPPGYYLGTIWATFWPSALFLIPGFAFAFRAAKGARTTDDPVRNGARLLLAWIVPFWLAIEIMPTKLPHYPLPLFPAFALMSAAAIMTLLSVKEFPYARRVGAVIFAAITLIFCGVIIWASKTYGGSEIAPFIIAVIVLGLGGVAAVAFWRQRARIALISALLAGVIFNGALYQVVLPSLSDFRIADRVNEAFITSSIRRPMDAGFQTFSPHYREPSLVYRLGTDIRLSDEGLMTDEAWNTGFVVMTDIETQAGKDLRDAVIAEAEKREACLRWLDPVDGFNYSKGDPVNLLIMEVTPCPS